MGDTTLPAAPPAGAPPAPPKRPPARERANATLDNIKLRLARKLKRDTGFWYDLMKFHALYATRETDPAVRATMKVLDKLLAEQRETNDRRDAGPGRGVVINIGTTINRGTRESREHALEVQAKLTNAPRTVEVDELAELAGDDDQEDEDEKQEEIQRRVRELTTRKPE